MTSGIRTIVFPVKDLAPAKTLFGTVGGEKLVATVTDADGNVIGLVQSP